MLKKTLFLSLLFSLFSISSFSQNSIEKSLLHSERLIAEQINTAEFIQELEAEWTGNAESFEEIRPILYANILKKKGAFISSHKQTLVSTTEVVSFKKELKQKYLLKLDEYRNGTFVLPKQHKHDGVQKILNGPFVNKAFEACDFSGWETRAGLVDSTLFGYTNDTINPYWDYGYFPGDGTGNPEPGTGVESHYIVSSLNGFDSIVPNLPMNMPGGDCSVLIGNGTTVNYGAASMNQTFLVDASNMDFLYGFAIVMNNPAQHTVEEKPFLSIRIYDENSDSIYGHDMYADNGDPGWEGTTGHVSTDAIVYSTWQQKQTSLSAYIGTNVR